LRVAREVDALAGRDVDEQRIGVEAPDAARVVAADQVVEVLERDRLELARRWRGAG
jgi:hypothetical protein